MEGLGAQEPQLAAFLKDDLRAVGSAAEAHGADAGDILADENALDAVAQRVPGVIAGGAIAVHVAAAADDHPAIPVEDEVAVIACPAGQMNIRRAAGDEPAGLEQAGLAADNILALVGQAVSVEQVEHAVQIDIARLILTGYEVHLPPGLAVGCPAGIQNVLGAAHIAALAAAELAGAAVIDQGVLVVCAAGLLLGVGIQDLRGAVSLHVIGGHAEAVVIRGHGQIHRVEFLGCHGKVEIGVVGDGIALLAGGTADEVDDTVLLIHRAALQRLRAGIGVIMPGEHEVDAHLVQHAGYHFVDLRIAAGDIGVVRGLMHAQDLPLGTALRRILLQPVQSLSQLALGSGIVDHGKIHIAIGNGIVAAWAAVGQVIDRRGRRAVAVTGILVVAQNVEDVHAAELIRAQHAGHFPPIAQAGGVIHRVAGLNAQRVIAPADHIGQRRDIGQILCLNIAQNKEVQRIRPVEGEGLFLGPGAVPAHPVPIGLTGRQAADGDAVGHNGLVAAAGKGAKLGGGPQRRPAAAVHRCILQQLLLAVGRAGQPADVLLRAAVLCRVVQNVKGQLALAHRVIAEHVILEGDVAGGVLGIDAVGAGGGAEPIRCQAALPVGGAQQAVIRQVHRHVGRRQAVAVLHAEGPAKSHDNGICRDRVIGRHRHGDLPGGEGPRALVRQLIAAGFHRIAENVALSQLRGYMELHRGDQVAGLRPGLQLRVNGHHAGKALVGIAALIAVGELHRVIREQLAQLQRRGNAAGLAAADLQADLLAQDRRCGIGRHGDGRRRVVRCIHCEVDGLGGLVAGLVAHGGGQGVRSVGQPDIAEVSLLAGGDGLEIIGIVVIGVDAVDEHAHGIQPAGVAVVHVVLLGGKVEYAVGQHGAVLQGLLIHGHAADDRVVHVIHVGAIHELHVVEIDAARRFGAHHLGAVNVHQAEGHAGLDGEGARELRQVRLQIAPAFPPHAGILVGPGALVRTEHLGLEGEVIRLIAAVAVRHIASEPQTGGGAVAFPLDADALGRIHPHADGRGHAGDRDLIAGTHAGALRHVGAGAEVEVELEGVTAEAHRLIIVDADDLRRLHAALAIVAGEEIAAVALAADGVVFLGGGDCAGFRVRIVLKVKHQRGQLAHDQVDAGGDAAVKGRRHRHRAVEALPLGGGEDVAVKGAQALVGQRPHQVARLVVHVAALVLDLHAEVRAVVEAQADLRGVEIDAVRLGQLNAGAAHHGAAAQRLHRHDALGIRGG